MNSLPSISSCKDFENSSNKQTSFLQYPLIIGAPYLGIKLIGKSNIYTTIDAFYGCGNEWA